MALENFLQLMWVKIPNFDLTTRPSDCKFPAIRPKFDVINCSIAAAID